MSLGTRIRISVSGWVLASGIAVALLTAVAVAFFAEPNGDDFCRAKLLPLIRAVEGWHASASPSGYAEESWKFWSGRWLANWIEPSVLSRTDLTTGYTAILFGAWSILAASCVGFVRLLTDASLSWARTFMLGIGLYALFWSTTPGIGDGYYWFTGFAENILPVATNIAVVAATARASATKRFHSVWIFGAALLAFVAPGLHELHSLGLVGALALGAFCSRARGRKVLLPWALSLVCACGGLALVVLAPGNARRAALFPPADLLLALRLTTVQMLRLLPEWVLSVPLLSATAWVVTMPDLMALRLGWVDEQLQGWRIWFVPVLTICMVLAGFLAPIYAMSVPAPERTLIGVYLVFLLGWFTTALLLRQRFGTTLSPRAGASLTSHSLSAVAFGLSLTFLGHVPSAAWELRTSMPRWRASLRARYDTLKTAPSDSGPVFVSPTGSKPSLFFTLDIEEDAKGWRNQCVAGYFGLRSVVLRPAPRRAGEER